MHVEYWICDYCKKIIEYDDKTKYTTPEMGYPFIPKGGGGKHYHLSCLINHYKRSKKKPDEVKELIEDAERRHNNQVQKRLKQARSTRDELEKRRSTKKDREELFNYFYDYYGLRASSKRLNSIIDKLNNGEDFDEIKNVKIPYYQLRDMLIYYRDMLNSEYARKSKKGEFINPLQRIFYDIITVINNLSDYSTKRKAVYNIVNNVEVDGGETLVDYSAYINPKAPRKNQRDDAKMEEIHKMVDEIMKEIEEEEEENQ